METILDGHWTFRDMDGSSESNLFPKTTEHQSKAGRMGPENVGI